MNADEIRAEIERRKKRASDLKLREVLWNLYDGHLSRYREWLLKDPTLVHPEVKEALEISDGSINFKMGTAAYRISYKEGQPEGNEPWWSDRDFEEETITPATLSLAVDGEPVFEFNIRRSTRALRSGPVWEDTMGEISRFTEGGWTVELAVLLQKVRFHEKTIRDQRELPALQQRMKQFGL